MVKACIFDLDGTLLNTIDSIAYFGNNALNKFGFKDIDIKRYKVLVGNGADVLIRRLLKENCCEDEGIFKKTLEYYVRTYDEDFLYKTTVYDGMKELLDELKENNIKIGVLSNKPHSTTQKVIEAMFGENYFDACYGKREGIPLKPDTTALFSLMDEFGVLPGECLYIGDTGTDMLTGKGGGLFTIGVLWGFRNRDELEKNGADIIISHPKEILKYI